MTDRSRSSEHGSSVVESAGMCILSNCELGYITLLSIYSFYLAKASCSFDAFQPLRSKRRKPGVFPVSTLPLHCHQVTPHGV